MKRKVKIECDNCKGTGLVDKTKKCLVCHGTGELEVIKKVEILGIDYAQAKTDFSIVYNPKTKKVIYDSRNDKDTK